ncbi:MAG: tryptophan--tRNA ligase [Chloroflexi bacterium]|nr:tryptophan--tRNA ligase [Chloroflexota bacterium]
MKRILTGIRPTGPLHLGHYAGALENWLRLQREYECFFLIADYQALSDHVAEIDRIRESVIQVTLDWLSIGLDPKHSAFVIQSYVPEHAELTMLLSMITPLGMLQRNPTLKAEMARLDEKELSVGFFNYPVSQIADILLPKAHLVPVGEDQLPHIELTREIARKFNRTYGDVFPEPEAMVGRVARLVGTDGQAKMSKSLGNCIYLRDDAKTVTEQVMRMYTDPTRVRPTDPGHIEGNPVFMYHDAFNNNKVEVADLKERYVAGRVGDVEVKQRLAAALNRFLDPIRERRRHYEQRPGEVKEALLDGTRRTKKVAEATMQQVRDAMRISNYTLVLEVGTADGGVWSPEHAMEELVRLRLEPMWDAATSSVSLRPVPGVQPVGDASANGEAAKIIAALGLNAEKAAAAVRKEVRRRVKGGKG